MPMESPHPDERPPKKRRFFVDDDSSPVQVRSKPSEQAPQALSSPTIVPDGTSTGDDAGALDGFDVAVWTVADDQQTRAAYEKAGATWIIEGPKPGDDWLDDAAGMASDGPPR